MQNWALMWRRVQAVRRQIKFKRLNDKSEREVAKLSKSECAAH